MGWKNKILIYNIKKIKFILIKCQQQEKQRKNQFQVFKKLHLKIQKIVVI